MLNKEVKIVKDTHILLAQKPDVNRLLLSNYLTQAGYQVYETRYARDIIMQLKNVQTDAILLDLNFPELDAYKKQINSLAKNQHIPIFFICKSEDFSIDSSINGFPSSDNFIEDNPLDGYEPDLSADNFITQPINRTQLLLIIKTQIKNSELKRKLIAAEVCQEAIFQHSPIAIAYTDPDLNIIRTNSQFSLQFGDRDKFEKISTIFSPSSEEKPVSDKQWLDDILQQGYVECEIETLQNDGQIGWSHVRSKLINFDTPDQGLVWMINDITVHKEEQQQILLSASVFTESGESMIIIDDNGMIEKINPAMQKLTGFSSVELHKCSVTELFDSPKNTQNISYILSLATRQKQWSGEFWLWKKNQEQFPARIIINCIKREDSSTSHFVAVLADISEGKAQELELKYRANHDPLTGLPNRNEFFVRLNDALASARRHQYCVALLYLDLDGFKPINDTLGHGKGDKVLQQVAEKLKYCVRNVDTVARLGGDEFTIILNGTSEEQVTKTAARIIKSITMRFENSLILSISIGISLFPNDAINPQKLLQYADKAMYKAKQNGKQSYCWHNAKIKNQ